MGFAPHVVYQSYINGQSRGERLSSSEAIRLPRNPGECEFFERCLRVLISVGLSTAPEESLGLCSFAVLLPAFVLCIKKGPPSFSSIVRLVLISEGYET